MEMEVIYWEVAPKLQSYLTGNGCSYAMACDIVQETFLRIWKRRDELSDDLHQVSGLAFTIARNYRNDLARKARHEVWSGENEVEGEDEDVKGMMAETRSIEVEEEKDELRKRLKTSLARMPIKLLEIFALSRLSKLTVKDIASGVGMSEANVKVRVHRAKELFRVCFAKSNENNEGEAWKVELGVDILKALMMLAAVDGEISKEELLLYRSLAEEFRGEKATGFDELWEQSVRAMVYIGFLTEVLSPEEIVQEYVREAGKISPRFIEELEQMASADGDYSQIERDCILALFAKSR